MKVNIMLHSIVLTLTCLVIIFAIISSTALAKDIIVANTSDADFRSIQEAVNGSVPGDTIVVRDGTYKENVVINVTHLTIRSEHENNNVQVESLNENENVFLIKANNVTISGFNITGGRFGILLEKVSNSNISRNRLYENNQGGVYLNDASYNKISENILIDDYIELHSSYDGLPGRSDNNNLIGNIIENGYIILGPHTSRNLIVGNEISNGKGITVLFMGSSVVSDNKISNCSQGIYAYDTGISVSNNRITDCSTGIVLNSALGLSVYNNTISNCGIGISFFGSSSGTLSNNKIIYCTECGIYSASSSASWQTIYNNYFNNTLNVKKESGASGWNSSLILGTNIVEGPYIGGNCWAKPDGTGFSQTCIDSNADGICDIPYNVYGDEFDYLPLVLMSRPQPVLPIANFSTNVTSGYVPLSVQFTDLSENATGWNWNFGDGVTSTEQDPVHTYTKEGEYTVELTVSNLNGKNSTTSIIECSPVVGVSLLFPQPPFWPGEIIPVTAEVYPALPGAHVKLESELDGWFADGYTDARGNFTGVYTIPNNALEQVKYMSNPGGFYLSALANGVQSIDYYCRVSEKPVIPVANFSSNIQFGSAPLSVQFTDLSENADEISWDFDNNKIIDSTDRNPVYTYEVPGSYTVNLTATNTNGSDSEIRTGYIVVSAQDTTDPLIESVVLFPTNTTTGTTINISVSVIDNIEISEVTAGDLQLLKINDIWQGSITAPSSIGDYSLLIKVNDTSGNIAETSVPYRVVQLSGGANIAVSPRSSSVVAGNTVSLSIKVKNTQNIDDTFKVHISVSELPASYQADLSWFNWTDNTISLKAGQEIQIPIKVTVPTGTATGLKIFRTNVTSATSKITGFDTGYLTLNT
ncbi:MAG: NosD domain-containing protein [Methanosarcina mazei]